MADDPNAKGSEKDRPDDSDGRRSDSQPPESPESPQGNSNDTSKDGGNTIHDTIKLFVGLFRSSAPAIVLLLLAVTMTYFAFRLITESAEGAQEQIIAQLDLVSEVQSEQISQFRDFLKAVGESTRTLNALRAEAAGLEKTLAGKRTKLTEDLEEFSSTVGEILNETLKLSASFNQQKLEFQRIERAKELENDENEAIITEHATTIRNYSEVYDTIFEQIFFYNDRIREFDSDLANEIIIARARIPHVRYKNAIEDYINDPQSSIDTLKTLSGIDEESLMNQINAHLDEFVFLIKFWIKGAPATYVFGALNAHETYLENTVSFVVVNGTVKRFNAQKFLFGIELPAEDNLCKSLWAARSHEYFQGITKITEKRGVAATWRFSKLIYSAYPIERHEMLAGEEPNILFISARDYRKDYLEDYEDWLKETTGIDRPKINFNLAAGLSDQEIDSILGWDILNEGQKEALDDIRFVLRLVRNGDVPFHVVCQSMIFTQFGEALAVILQPGFRFDKEGSILFGGVFQRHKFPKTGPSQSGMFCSDQMRRREVLT